MLLYRVFNAFHMYGQNNDIDLSLVNGLRRVLRRCACACLLFAVPGVLTRSAATGLRTTEELSVKLNKRLSNYNPGVFNFVGALLHVSNEFQIPMGITWVDSPTARAEKPFAWNSATIEEIIQAITETQPGYQVKVRNGVVHIFPAGLPDAESFLKIKLPGFQTQDTVVEFASLKLHIAVTPMRAPYQVSIAGPGDSQVTVELANCLVEDVLDAFAVSSNRKTWIVTLPDKVTLTPSGFRRTRSLFTDDPIPDDQQPVWYLHRLDDPAPPVLARNKLPQSTPGKSRNRPCSYWNPSYRECRLPRLESLFPSR